MSIVDNISGSLPFCLGALVVVLYAWERFNEPSFPQEETLPRTLVPLRYLFLKPGYGKARLYYVLTSALFYFALVLPGPTVLQALGLSTEKFPPQAWPLLVAALLVGIVPNPNMKWINIVEDRLRRRVHSWFLVPDGVKGTIAVLEDASYQPPPEQLEAVESPMRDLIEHGLRLPRSTLRHRWARAAMLMESINRARTDESHPLRMANFTPFQDDLKSIRVSYAAMRHELEPLCKAPAAVEPENLNEPVDALLRRMYAYISWGLRHEAESDRVVFGALEQLGFRVPISLGNGLFDIVAPALLAIVALQFLFSWALAADHGGQLAADQDNEVSTAVTSAAAGGLMYGSAVWIALTCRGDMIEESAWRQSTRCFAAIGVRAGLATWGVIVLATVLGDSLNTWISIRDLWSAATSATVPSKAAWWLPRKVSTALPWFLAGATCSTVLAYRLGGDVRRIRLAHRLRDAVILGSSLGVAASFAQLIQIRLAPSSDSLLASVWPTLVMGCVIGCIIGTCVPQAFRRDLLRPFRAHTGYGLRHLLDLAGLKLGNSREAEDWVFSPNEDLDGLTPAEAMRYRNKVNRVKGLLEKTARSRAAGQPGDEAPVISAVVTGGRRAA